MYAGKINAIGFDGIWRGPDGHSLVIEVKTTDAYRINLDTLAKYREDLKTAGKITDKSAILIVVGRFDTGDIEAQVRGSRHAWDIRLISIDALIKLVQIKEKTEEEATLSKICSLLKPFEYTRVDYIIDVMFATTEDAQNAAEGARCEFDAAELAINEVNGGHAPKQQHTPPETLRQMRTIIAKDIGRALGCMLIAKSPSQYWDESKGIRIACALSKKHAKTSTYWYAYHKKWNQFLRTGERGFFVLGCVGLKFVYCIPVSEFAVWLPKLYTTGNPANSGYWHVELKEEDEERGLRLMLRKTGEFIEINQYKLEIRGM